MDRVKRLREAVYLNLSQVLSLKNKRIYKNGDEVLALSKDDVDYLYRIKTLSADIYLMLDNVESILAEYEKEKSDWCYTNII